MTPDHDPDHDPGLDPGLDPDVIVVGGGHNGLVCAAYLARAGKRVVLLEARPSVGGCASTVDALGARVNICNCDHFAVRSLPLVEELGLDRHGLAYLDLDLTMAALSWSGDQPFLQFHDVSRTVESLRATLPDQVEGYQRFVADALPALRLVLYLAQAPPGPRSGLAALAAGHGKGLATLLRWSRRSAAQVLRGYFTSETILGAAVAGGPAVWGVSPHTPGTGLGALRLAMPHAVRPGRPIGGSGALTDALRASFEAAGGRVLTGARAERVLIEGDRVLGVRAVLEPAPIDRATGGAVARSAAGAGTTELLRAALVVVACDPRATTLEWTGAIPSGLGGIKALAERWQGRARPPGYESKLDALISELPMYRQIDERLLGRLGLGATDVLGATTFITPTVDAIHTAHQALQRNEMVAEPILLANVPSVADQTMRAPGGAHVFSLEVLFTPYDLAGGWVDSPEPGRWLEAFAGHTDGGFLAGVQQWRAMTPDRYEQEFFMPKGYAQSFAGGPLAALLGRDRELSRYRTPVRGLFVTGAATFPGAGIWGASGRNTAQVVLGR
ncbi:MAG: phytoene desaturase family protein [Acidimicrobiales bacterium]